MVGLAIGDNRKHSFLISDAGEGEIRKLLRREGMRPSRPGFTYLGAPLKKFSSYRLTGDEHLKIQQLRLPVITWGKLSMFLLGLCSPGYLFSQEAR